MAPTPTSSPTRRPPARRCLFGRPNPENVDRMLKAALAGIKQSYENKYGFSFEFDTPLATTSDQCEYVFEPISVDTVPEFYRPRYYPSKPELSPPKQSDSTNASPVSSTSSSPRESDVSMDLTPISPRRRMPKTPKKRQQKVTDYMPVTKHKRLQRSSKRLDIVLPTSRVTSSV